MRRFQQHGHFANCSNSSGILEKLCEAIVVVRAPFPLKIVARCDDRGETMFAREKSLVDGTMERQDDKARKDGRGIESRNPMGNESRPVGDPIRAAGFFQRRES